MKLSSLHIVTKYRIALAIVLTVLCTFGAEVSLAQLPVRTREVRLLSNNNTNFVRLQAPNGMTTDWTLLPPLTVGTSSSITYSTVTGSNAQLSWLAPGADGSVLTMVAGVPGWTPGGGSAWLLSGNSNALATNFMGPTSASIPLNFATANATPGSMNWYLGTVAPANLRMDLSTASGLQIGNATNAVNTSVTGTFSTTGTTTLASAASSNVAILNAVTPGTFTVNGTALTPNVTMTSLSGVAKATVPVGYDRILLANATGSIDEASFSAVLGAAGWLLTGNAGATASNFLGPTTASVPLNLATANAVPGSVDFYLGTVAPANLRMSLSTGSGFQIGNATNAANTSVTGTFSSTGTTTLASAASSNVAILNAVTPGTFTVNGTALTPNVTITSLGGVAKATVPVGYDRILLANATGSIDEASFSAVLGAAGWLLTGNAGATASNFLGPTTASVPLNLATANAIPGSVDFYLGTVAAANLRMSLSTGSGFQIGNATNAVNTTVTGTLSSTGTTTLASAASANVAMLNAVTPGTFTVNGTALTPNVTMTSLSGVAKAAVPVGYDRILLANATGSIDEASFSAVLGAAGWLLAGNSGATASSFLGPTTASVPLNFATANATPGTMNWYLGTVAPANLRMVLSTASGLQIGNVTNAVNTSVTGTLSSTGTTTLASAASSNVAILNAATPGTFTVNGTALTPNVTMTSLSGVAKATVPVGYDRILLANATGSIDEASFTAVLGAAGWLLTGNSGATAASFLGPTTAGVPLNLATANAVPGSVDFYLGTVAAANLRMSLSSASGFQIGNATNAVNTAVTGTLSSTGTTTLASAASSNVAILNAVTPGTFTVNGTALTPNVTMTSLGGVAKATIPVGYDRVVLANSTGSLDEASLSAIVSAAGWSLSGNSITAAWTGAAGSFLGTTNTQPLSIATTNLTPQDIVFYSGIAGVSKRMEIDGSTGYVGIGNITPATSMDVDGGLVTRPGANVLVTANAQIVTPGNRSYIVLDPGGVARIGLILANGLQIGQILVLRVIETSAQPITLPDAAASNVDLTGNWVGAANDIISLIWTGVDWVETSRSNN